MQNKLQLVRQNYEVFGLWATFRMSLSYLLRSLLGNPPKDKFDKRYGVTTDGNETVGELGIFDPYSVFYVPTHERVMQHILEHVAIDYGSYTFVDFGCGKGRAVLMAMTRPFKKVIGVELSAAASNVARKNVEIFARKGLQQCGDVEICHQNAVDFSMPSGNVLFYFYRPFLGPVMERVLDNIAASGSYKDGRHLLVYSCCTDDMLRILTFRNELIRNIDFSVIDIEYSWSLWESTNSVTTINQHK